ncbi:MAG: hypothetical protein Q8J74_06590 [Candidatus Didemnitutus sp.]|nr:hypothetical protein [Candidatus Didemnitutus sp.]
MNAITDTELQDIEGGLSFLLTITAGIVIGAAVQIMSDWDDFKKGFSDGLMQK